MLDSFGKTKLNISTYPKELLTGGMYRNALEDNVDHEGAKYSKWKRLITNGRIRQNLRKENIWVGSKNV